MGLFLSFLIGCFYGAVITALFQGRWYSFPLAIACTVITIATLIEKGLL